MHVGNSRSGALILLTVLSWPVGWLMVTVQYQSAVALQSPVPTECVPCYVDYAAGDDRNPGNAPSTAWKTLAKINSTFFHPGDRILFKSGSVWTGQLWPTGS